MVEESKKRFEAIMNKLFDAPRKSSSKSDEKSIYETPSLSGKKRHHSSLLGMSLAGNVLGESLSSLSGLVESARAPNCRPWDRDDLFRRLSTFKSITWFAKPQVASPLECARRGWINENMDTIACASCGARLLFSTPSAWSQQQVEKAAMVFSLKLESGHKLICPWTNNVCTEELAHFPIVSQDRLVEDYKRRIISLSQLIALPVISLVSTTNTRSSQLVQFLREPSILGYSIPLENCSIEIPGDVPGSTSSLSYYQVQKFISLLGWEPYLLPYTVDFKDGQHHCIRDASQSLNQKIHVYSLCNSNDTDPSTELQLDPSSLVLHCKLCGASVGLWAFNNIPRPLEYIRFVGREEVSGKMCSATDDASSREGSSAGETCKNAFATASTSKDFTIAGGPPPAMLDYSANISLPIIKRNLRARFAIEAGDKDPLAIQRLSQVEEGQQISNKNENGRLQEASDIPLLDLSAKHISEEHQIVAEDSVRVNLAENLRPFNLSASHSHSRKGGESESNRDETAETEKPGHYSSKPGETKKHPSTFTSLEFDAIKHHRHFCPWIVAAGKFAPGWQLTLSALDGGNVLNNSAVTSLIEVDDPVASVRELFTTPSKKRRNDAGEAIRSSRQNLKESNLYGHCKWPKQTNRPTTLWTW